tara:strand:+ start:184 stop:555 length:372 start_codon:yes stop_codon:yes gene_type:complete
MIEIPERFFGAGELLQYATLLSGGMFLRAHIKESIALNSLERKFIPIGLSIALPEGYEAQVRPTSGLASKHDTTVLNAPETIDADYCGDIGLILVNLLQEPFKIATHDLIAKFILAQYVNLEW